MNTYRKASADVEARAKKLRKKYHEHLNRAKVRIDYLFVISDNEDGKPLSVNGYACDGVVKILSQEQRGAGRGDAVILIDKQVWDRISDKEKDALLDHELEHLKVVEKDGEIVWDGNDRPKLKMKKHDVNFGWFIDVAKRHGEASAEVKQARAIVTRAGETFLPGFDFLAKVEGKPTAADKGKVVKMPSQQPAASEPKAAAAK